MIICATCQYCDKSEGSDWPLEWTCLHEENESNFTVSPISGKRVYKFGHHESRHNGRQHPACRYVNNGDCKLWEQRGPGSEPESVWRKIWSHVIRRQGR